MKRVHPFPLAALTFALALSPAPSAQQPQPPKFTSTVEVTPIDVTVVDDRGRPIQDLGVGDFTVRIDNNPRKVVSAEWISLVPETTETTTAAPLPEGYSSNERSTGGRLIVLAIDQPNIRFGGERGIERAASSFIDRLQPVDRVAVLGFGRGAPSTPFTADRERIKQAINAMTGQKASVAGMVGDIRVSLTEALAIVRNEPGALETAIARECAGLSRQQLDVCRGEVQNQALEIAQNVDREGLTTIRSLREVINGLRTIPAPKTLILISEGFVIPAAETSEVVEIGAAAAAARTSLYTLKLEDQMFDASDSRAPIAPMADRQERSNGLETLAVAARGALFTVAGTGTGLFERIESELSGYYLLGLEADPRDRDGKPHPVKVEVPRKGVTVRARRQMLVMAAADAAPKTPREAVAVGLNSPLLLSGMPLRVVTFSLQGPEQGKVQLLIHADVGSDYTAPQRVALAYTISDRTGRVVSTQTSESRLGPTVNGVPGALQFVAGASVAPGEYTLKLAAAEGEKVGSIEHPIHALLVDAGAVKLSELMVGGPVESGDLLRPTIGYTVAYGAVHGYLEAYGSGSARLKVKYEIAPDEKSAPLLQSDVAARQGGDNRVLFSQTIPVRELPPGKYLLRAVISSSGAPIKTMTRAFEVAAPAVLMTSATGSAGESAPDLFLPVEDEALAAPFRREDALAPTVVQAFRERVSPATKPPFEEGLKYIEKGQLIPAELALKRAIQPDADSTAGLAYLAVCFAASGHDAEAANVWQTALVDGSDIPQLYEWLGNALLRTHDLTAARSIFEEAAGRWPADARFARPLALLYATFGKGREAVRALEQYIDAGHADAETLFLAVQWLFQVHVNGQRVHNRAEDVKLARAYADQYSKANGPKQALVKQWVDFIEQQK